MTIGSILRYKSATEAIGNAMRADGVDIMYQPAVDAWLADFNSLPDEERQRFFGRHLDPCAQPGDLDLGQGPR